MGNVKTKTDEDRLYNFFLNCIICIQPVLKRPIRGQTSYTVSVVYSR